MSGDGAKQSPNPLIHPKGKTITMALRETLARALCEADGYDPDRLEPGDDPYQEQDGFPSPCIDGHNRKGEPCHFFWRRYDRIFVDEILAIPQIAEALRHKAEYDSLSLGHDIRSESGDGG